MGQEAEVMVEVVKMMPPVRTLVIAVAEMVAPLSGLVAPPPKVTAAAAPCGGGLYCGHGG